MFFGGDLSFQNTHLNQNDPEDLHLANIVSTIVQKWILESTREEICNFDQLFVTVLNSVEVSIAWLSFPKYQWLGSVLLNLISCSMKTTKLFVRMFVILISRQKWPDLQYLSDLSFLDYFIWCTLEAKKHRSLVGLKSCIRQEWQTTPYSLTNVLGARSSSINLTPFTRLKVQEFGLCVHNKIKLWSMV